MPRTEKKILIGGVSLDQKGLRTTAPLYKWNLTVLNCTHVNIWTSGQSGLIFWGSAGEA